MNSKSKDTVIIGKARLIPTADVDTDMIFHNKYLHITKMSEMGKLLFSDVPEYRDLPKTIEPGDIVITGPNFGCGSSRQQAVDGFIALGVSAIIGESFGAIYKRNAINAGLPLLEVPEILTLGISDGDLLKVELENGKIFRMTDEKQNGDVLVVTKPMSQVQMDIYFAGGLLQLGKVTELSQDPHKP